MARALITGVTGQDGAYLAALLLDKGYDVFGMGRRSSSSDGADERLRWLGIAGRVRILDGNLMDMSSLIRIVSEVMPDEVYNLGAQSLVATSWHEPLLTGQVTALGANNLLEAVRLLAPKARCAASSSSRARSATASRASASAWQRSCGWATWRHPATGAMRATMSAPCG